MSDYLTAREAIYILRERLQEATPDEALQGSDFERRLQAASSDAPGAPITEFTYPDFMTWCPDGIHAEWIDGKVFVMSPASRRHQQIVAFLVSLLGEYVNRHDLGEVLPAPFQMKLNDQRRGREPDVLFVAASHLDRLTATFLDGPADLVIEVISAESLARDRGEKFVEYETARIPEYWLIDPLREEAEFYLLDDRGRYSLVSSGHSGRHVSPLLDQFGLQIDWLWQQPLPSIIDILLPDNGEEQPR